jgi:hypothetical protein
MFSQTTRLETIIVAVALLVLLLCSQPPRSGNADVYLEPETASQTLSAPAESSDPAEAPPVLPVEPEEADETETVDDEPGDVDVSGDASAGHRAATPEAPRPAKRLAMVDARSCPGLDHDEIMYGEVTVRLIWNGNKLVPQKVCVVEGEDGVSTVWSFDQPPAGAIISEISDTQRHVR